MNEQQMKDKAEEVLAALRQLANKKTTDQQIENSVEEMFATLRQLANKKTLTEVDKTLTSKLKQIDATDPGNIEVVLSSLSQLELTYLLWQALIAAKRYDINVRALQLFINNQ